MTRRTGGSGRRPGPSPGAVVLAALLVLAAVIAGVAAAQSGPTARLSVEPNPVHPDQLAVLDGRNSTGDSAGVEFCEFDVDGDGAYEAQRDDCRLEHTFRATGEVAVGLRITTGTGQRATDTEPVRVVENQPPEPAIEVDPARPVPGQTVTLSAAGAVDADGRIVDYAWTLLGETRSGETTTTAFPDPGTYPIRLAVTDDDGGVGTATERVEVSPNDRPIAALSVATPRPTAGDAVRFDAGASRDPDGAVVAYRWDLDGDGTTDLETTEAVVRVDATEPGEYAAGVSVVDDRGATDRASVTYVVAAPASPTATPAGSATGGGNTPGVLSGAVVPVLAAVFLLLVVAGAAVGVRRREAVAERASTVRELLSRGDVRHRLARLLSGTTVKQVTKQALRRLSDAIEAAGTGLGEAVERVGRAIKRASERLAAFLRRLAG